MPPLFLARLIAGAVCGWIAVTSSAQGLPANTEAALRRAKLPTQALAAVVQDTQTGERRLAWNAEAPVNPASVFKLFTTYAALDKLGPAWTWSTPVYLSGTLRAGVLDGSVTIKGSGDPKLVLERLWLLLRRLRQMGVQEIRGDIVLDNSAFTLPDVSPADFDGEAHRPYNVQPDALLLNYKSFTLGFVPDPGRGVATVLAEPDLAGVAIDGTVPLSPAPCGDWRAGLKATLADAGVLHFAGTYPASCAEKSWPVAYADPRSYNARVLEKLWQELGGKLLGKVRGGLAPAGVAPSFELTSPPLAEVVRDINKFSNNVMAEQVFLTLGALAAAPVPVPVPVTAPTPAPIPNGVASQAVSAGVSVGVSTSATTALAQTAPASTQQAAREALQRWVRERWGEAAARGLVVDNGSGLSRSTRVSADLLARLLQSAFASPVMPELMSSLPVSGLDGTLRRSSAPAGRAHLKTGSLRDVAAVAGYVLGTSGRRYVVVAILNDDNAAAGRPALDALVQWAIDDGPATALATATTPAPATAAPPAGPATRPAAAPR